MRGNEKVIRQLNQALKSELTAIVQYMVQAETFENWGYARLGGYLKRRAVEEMHHAEGLIERLVFLDSSPDVHVPLTPKISGSVREQMEADLADEDSAIAEYNAAIKICAEAADFGTRDLFNRLLQDEEKHADFLEAQLKAMDDIGVGGYLSQQLHAEK